MKHSLVSDYPITNEAAKKSTGKTLDEWFESLDEKGGPKQGRRSATNLLYKDLKIDAWWSVTIAVEYERHHGLKKKDGLYEGYGICSTKTISAPLAEVYAGWVNGTSLNKWFGNGTKADVQADGEYENSDGDKGTYLRVRENKDLRFTWENSAFSSASRVDALFSDKGKGKTGLIVNHSRIQTREEADSLRASWAKALTKLKDLMED